MTINDRIHELRKVILHLTLEEFGKRLGVGKSAISDVEKGRNNVSEQLFRSICREFHVSEKWLRDGEGDPFIKMDPHDELMEWAAEMLADESDSFRRRFIKMLSRLSVDDWEVLEKLCRELFTDEKED